MRCWECKRKILKARRVPYTDGREEKCRDVCFDCLRMLYITACGFAEVAKISQRQIKNKQEIER